MDKQYIVGIADMKLCRQNGVLITYALGSCIGICLYDPVIRLAGLIHIMLPVNQEGQKTSGVNIYKYADSAIPETIRKMEAFGSVRTRMVSKIAGGAKMFDIPGNGSLGNIGKRNSDTVKLILKEEKIRLLKEDVGGNYARTLSFDAGTGIGSIRTFGREEIIF